MKKLIFALICSTLVSSAVASPPNHYRGGYNRNPVPIPAQRYHAPQHYHHGYYYNNWYWAAPLIAGTIGYAIAANNYPPPMYVERQNPTTRLINGRIHELRYVYDNNCLCDRAVWVPLEN